MNVPNYLKMGDVLAKIGKKLENLLIFILKDVNIHPRTKYQTSSSVDLQR